MKERETAVGTMADVWNNWDYGSLSHLRIQLFSQISLISSFYVLIKMRIINQGNEGGRQQWKGTLSFLQLHSPPRAKNNLELVVSSYADFFS